MDFNILMEIVVYTTSFEAIADVMQDLTALI
jgi:hypothetical protein